jgi:putative membrane protein
MNRGRRPVLLRLIAPLAAWPWPAVAHGPIVDATADNVAVVLLLALSALLYARGVRRLWRGAGRGRGASGMTVALFAAGWLVLAASLFGPLERESGRLFTAHMVQHELLMLVAAPLLVLGAPLSAWAWALPRAVVDAVARGIGRSTAWRAVSRPAGAWLLHALVLWLWHIPALFEAALLDRWIHHLQHASFLGSALLFWWTLLRERGSRRGDGVAVVLLFTTMLHTGALGALLTFSTTPWYAPYVAAPSTRLSPLEDQQIGGLVMWVPGGLAYLAAALALMARWLREPRARTLR